MVNFGDPNIDYEELEAKSTKKKPKKKKKKNVDGTEVDNDPEDIQPKHEDDPLSVDANGDDNDPKKETLTKGKAKFSKKDGQLETLEPESFEYRYFCRQNDSVILAMAMISEHSDIAFRERTIASKWIDTWDDCTSSYSYLRIKAKSLSDV